MAWRKPTREDLETRLSQAEAAAFGRSSDFSYDTVESVIAQAAAFARDAIRSGGRCRLSPIEGEIPEGMMRPAMSIAVLDLLNRFSLLPSEARREAARSAEEYLKEVAAGRIVPEPYAADGGEEPKGAGPAADNGPKQTLGGGLW